MNAEGRKQNSDLGDLKMPEVILCRYCKQSISKEADQSVVIEK
jgi:hypothetical protein